MIHGALGRRFLVAAALAAGYFAAGKLGLLLAFYNPSASPVWPPTGLSLAALLVLGRSYWPSVALGAFLANYFTQGSALTCAAIAAGNCAEAWAAAWAVERFARGRDCLLSTSTIFAYVPIVLGAAVISATVGALSLVAGSYAGRHEFHSLWLTWWMGDAASALIFTPVILLFTKEPGRIIDLRFRLERAAAFALLSLCCMALFGGYLSASRSNLPLEFVFWPVLLWIAFRIGQRETALANLVLAMFAVCGTLNGWGPFAAETPNMALVLVQSYLGIVSVSTLAFSSLDAEREAATAETRRLNLELEDRVRERSKQLLMMNQDLRREIVDRRAAEEALARQSKALARSNAELEMFASVVSHDLQEPLRKIISFGELLEKKSHRLLGPEGADFLGRMRGAAARMQALIRDLLNFSKATYKTAPFKSVPLSEVVQEVLSDLEVAVETVHAQVEIGSLPSVFADRTQMRQLFQNLLANAFKFTRSPRIPRVKIEVENSDGQQAWISVSDNGIGFPQEAEEELFQPFRRLQEKDRVGGTGMGLAICRKIVRRHGGTIAAIGSPGQGSRFIVSLPLAARGQEAGYAHSTYA